MLHSSLRRLVFGASQIAFFLFVTTAAAQPRTTGTLSVFVRGAGRVPVAGAAVTVNRPDGEPLTKQTDALGYALFATLPPGEYGLSVDAPGFAPVRAQPRIDAGETTSIRVRLAGRRAGGALSQTGTPMIDTNQSHLNTVLTNDELQRIPNARDPWAILQTAPGVLTDRVNVDGTENGQPFVAVGQGAPADQAIWSVDGVVITDMAALGSTPAYFDFDSFEEMQVTTGGSDASIPTGGVVLNMITKRGTNDFHGSGRYLWTGKQSNPFTIGLPLGQFSTGQSFKPTIKDYGAELGGPIVKDRLWFWGGYGTQDIKSTAIGLNGVPFDRETKLGSGYGNMNYAVTSSNRLSGSLFHNTRTNDAGPQPTINLTTFRENSPYTIYDIRDSQIFSSNFYVTGLYSHVNDGFTTTPFSPQSVNVNPDGVFLRSYPIYDVHRDFSKGHFSSSSFFNTGSLAHELKFGAGYRVFNDSETGSYPGKAVTIFPGTVTPSYVAFIPRINSSNLKLSYGSFYAQDSLRLGNSLKLDLGVRYDRQTGTPGRSTSVNPFNPSNSLAVDGGRPVVEWRNFEPRLGLSYILEWRTTLRASYARYADQLGANVAQLGMPFLANSFRGAEFIQYDDTTGDRTFDLSKHFVSFGVPGFTSQNDPKLLLPDNRFGPNFRAPITTEGLFGVDHSCSEDFSYGANFRYRRRNNIFDRLPLVDASGITREGLRSDYVLFGIHQGTYDVPGLGTGNFRVPIYSLSPNLTPLAGVSIVNGDREQTYKGASFYLDKRLSHNWQLRGNVDYNNWTWTTVPATINWNPTDRLGSGGIQGVQVGEPSSAFGRGGIYINSKWSYSVDGLYRIAPDSLFGVDLSGSVWGRKGFPAPIYQTLSLPQGDSVPAALTGFDQFRYPNPTLLNFRIGKPLMVAMKGLDLSFEAFNVLNRQPAILRDLNQASVTRNFLFATAPPRIFRLGARFKF